MSRHPLARLVGIFLGCWLLAGCGQTATAPPATQAPSAPAAAEVSAGSATQPATVAQTSTAPETASTTAGTAPVASDTPAAATATAQAVTPTAAAFVTAPPRTGTPLPSAVATPATSATDAGATAPASAGGQAATSAGWAGRDLALQSGTVLRLALPLPGASVANGLPSITLDGAVEPNVIGIPGYGVALTLPVGSAAGPHTLAVRWGSGNAGTLQLRVAGTATLAASLGEPDDLTVAPDGSILFSDLKSNRVEQVLADGAVRPLASGLHVPEGLAVSGPGALLLAEQGTNRVLGWSAGAGLRTLLQLPPRAGTEGIDGLDIATVDGHPVGLIPDSANGRLLLLRLDTLSTVVVPGHWQRPTAATLRAGRLYLVDEYGGRLWRGAAAGPLGAYGPALSLPDDVVVTADGTAYVNELGQGGHGSISQIASSGAGARLLTGLSDPQGLALDAVENLILAESGSGRISALVRSCRPLLLGSADLRLPLGGPALFLPLGSDCVAGASAPAFALQPGGRWPEAMGSGAGVSPGAQSLILANGTAATLHRAAGSALLELRPPLVAPPGGVTATLAVLLQVGGGALPLQLQVTVQ